METHHVSKKCLCMVGKLHPGSFSSPYLTTEMKTKWQKFSLFTEVKNNFLEFKNKFKFDREEFLFL